MSTTLRRNHEVKKNTGKKSKKDSQLSEFLGLEYFHHEIITEKYGLPKTPKPQRKKNY